MTNLKEELTRIIGSNPNLNAKQYYHLVKNNAVCSYQGIHKALNQLLKENKIEKKQNTYALNPTWVESQKKFFEKVKSISSGKEDFDIETLKEGETKTIHFTTPVEMAYWMIREYNKILKSKTKKLNLMRWQYSWPGIMVSDQYYPKLQRMFELGNFTITCEKQTQLDQIIAKYYSEMGAKIVFNSTLEDGLESFVVEDYVLKIFWTKESINARKKIYEKTPNLDKAITELYKHGFRKDDDINVLIIRNKEMANAIRKSTKKLFV